MSDLASMGPMTEGMLANTVQSVRSAWEAYHVYFHEGATIPEGMPPDYLDTVREDLAMTSIVLVRFLHDHGITTHNTNISDDLTDMPGEW